MEKDKILELGSIITQRVLSLHQPHPEKNMELMVRAQDLRNYYQYQFNPEKRETPEGELSRWLTFVRERGILWAYQYETDSYVFTNELAHRVKQSLINEGIITPNN